MTQLKLGRLPKSGVVRLHIAILETLKDELDRYAAEYSKLYEPADLTTLIPYMLEAFVRSDRGYRRRVRKAARPDGGRRSGATAASPAPTPAPAKSDAHK
jgi:hypothetical protein